MSAGTRHPSYLNMTGADYHLDRLLSRSKSGLIALLFEAMTAKDVEVGATRRELLKRNEEIEEIKAELQRRNEAAHFEPIESAGESERALRALSIVLTHTRDEVVKDLTAQLSLAHQECEMLANGEGKVAPILILITPFIEEFPEEVARMMARSTTVRGFITQLQTALTRVTDMVHMSDI